MGQSAPNPTSLEAHLGILSVIGAFGLVSGIHHMLNTRREVLVAPMSGFLFCVGVTGLITKTWDELTKFEHWAGFLALVVLAGGQTWLVFRGLLDWPLAACMESSRDGRTSSGTITWLSWRDRMFRESMGW